MTLKDKPAYPHTFIRKFRTAAGDQEEPVVYPGETLFESFVKAAMQGFCANHVAIESWNFNEVAEKSIKIALAQIEALEKHYAAESAKQEEKA